MPCINKAKQESNLQIFILAKLILDKKPFNFWLFDKIFDLISCYSVCENSSKYIVHSQKNPVGSFKVRLMLLLLSHGFYRPDYTLNI